MKERSFYALIFFSITVGGYFSMARYIENSNQLKEALELGFVNQADYSNAKERGFATKEEQIKAQSLGFKTNRDYEQALSGGYRNAEEYIEGMRSGFKVKDQFLFAKKLGFVSYSDFKEATDANYKDANEWLKGKLGGFTRAQDFRNAAKKNFTKYDVWIYAQKYQFVRQSDAEPAMVHDIQMTRAGGFRDIDEYKEGLKRGANDRTELIKKSNGNLWIDLCHDTDDGDECKKGIGRNYTFYGKIVEFETSYKVRVLLGSDEFADVYFNSPVARKTDKDFSFHGTLVKVGTGVITHHTITDAEIGKLID